MTTIEYGGGPSLEQRRAFANLEDGGHVPGYMGFCPQFKYRYGHTFGKETSEIAKNLPYYFGPRIQGSHHFYPVTRENNKFDPLRTKFNDDVPGRMLPKSTGDNKYTEGMVPGYSGNIPQMNFKFGRTYRNLSDECVDQLVKEYKSSELRQNRLKESSNLMTNLHPVTYDPLVKNHLNIWTDDMVKKNSDVHSYMSSTEPPIPGYKGFIPRMDTTESGLAKRFHEAAQSSLETFRAECKNHFDHMDMPMTRLDISSRPHSSIPYTPNSNYYSARIFHQEGMIPDYEGHIHGYQYHVGKNFGNTTRDLEVCAHPYSCYGEYLKIKNLTKKYLS
uniref:Protein FAM166B n=2 Tax=Schistosoma TaxID=6181 RepID=A0A3Q0KKG8_SCHMA